MELSRARLAFSIIVAAAIVFSGCQAAAPAPAAPEKKAEPAAAAKPATADKPAAAAEKPAAAPAKSGAVPANLPKSTQEFLGKIKKDASYLAGLDDELKVPQEWIDGAKKEGKVTIIYTMDAPEAKVWGRPFEERYPFIKFTYTRGSDEEKAKAIVSAQAGRATTDILIGVNSKIPVLDQAGLSADMSGLPAWKFVPEGLRSPKGTYVGRAAKHWGFTYNTNKVKKEELPKTWEEVLTSPIFKGGKLGVSNDPESWLLGLWAAKGEPWAKDFAAKLLTDVKPQMRKEDLNAMVDITGAGEINIGLPTAPYRTVTLANKGAPVAWFSPEPVPLTASAMVALKSGPNPNAARIFFNWAMSKEGQLGQYAAASELSVRPEMEINNMLPYPDFVIGKKLAHISPKMTMEYGDALQKYWSDLWLKGGGEAKKKK